jgi:hypothetical protein
MNLKDIAHISGKSGLFKIIKPTRTGVIAESLDDKKLRQMVGMNNRVSVLKEISIYTLTEEGSEPLEKVMTRVYEKHAAILPVSPDASSTQLSDFLTDVLPEYDKSRVYASDIKRLVSWYEILLRHAPELFEQQPEEKTTEPEPVAEQTDTEIPGNEVIEKELLPIEPEAPKTKEESVIKKPAKKKKPVSDAEGKPGDEPLS